MSDHFQFAPDILQRLGEELLPQPDQSIIELVRNAYDADSVGCSVTLENVDKPGGTLKISDGGIGMTAEAIRTGWLVLGRSTKEAQKPTELGRVPVGEKGLGRLAALRLGRVVELVTRPKQEPGVEYSLRIDWDRFDSAMLVEEVNLEIRKTRTTKSQGTDISLMNLRGPLTSEAVHGIARSLILLSDPFGDPIGFHPALIAPEFKELEAKVKASYFGEAEYHLVAQLEKGGCWTAEVYDSKGKLEWSFDQATSRKPKRYQTASSTFNLWVFVLAAARFSNRTQLAELREWLQIIGGVHVYHRNLRVHPYGDPGHDWLDMNLQRAQSPEFRPSTNTSLGVIKLDDQENLLVPKTDRSGFIENDGYRDLVQFGQDVLDWLAGRRLAKGEAVRVVTRRRSAHGVVNARADLERGLSDLRKRDRDKIAKVTKSLLSAVDREETTARRDLQLYRTIATVGTTFSVFGHEAGLPSQLIEKSAEESLDIVNTSVTGKTRTLLVGHLEIIVKAARALGSFARLPMNLLAKNKRVNTLIDVHKVIRELAATLQPFLVYANINPDLSLATNAEPQVAGSVAAMESIVVNLMINAARALKEARLQRGARHLKITTDIAGGNLVLRVMDNGDGIQGIELSDIWLPGMTTLNTGTGLGLTIVKDAAADLGGEVAVIANGELGGAEFSVILPLARS